MIRIKYMNVECDGEEMRTFAELFGVWSRVSQSAINKDGFDRSQ